MATIDNLDIQISASTESASKAISNLVSNLGVLEQALGKINAKTYAKQMEQFAASIKKVDEAAKSSGNGLGEIANQAGKVSSSMKTMPSAVNLFSSSISKATKHTRSLASVFGSLYANFFWIRRIFAKGLGAIEIASDLTEVQNVVDVTFDNMAYKLDEFAESSRQTFGLSELSAKTYASQFQAMFKAMGITAEDVAGVNKRLAGDSKRYLYSISKGYELVSNDISDMSLNLTKLAADMGSFFNQNPADVAKRLQAGVVSGQSRALRQYGLDLTVATLQTWANKRGIDAQVDSMTQAEKTMLRYQYVMENMAMAQGDFARTAMTWANQVKLLKQNFQALGAVIGVALVNAIKPAVIFINNAMNTIIALVQKAVNAIGKLLGWQIEISSVGTALDEESYGIGSALEEASDGAAGTAGGLQKANKAAKELKKTILGFDELNVLNGADQSANDGDAGGGGAGGGAGGAGGGDFGGFTPPKGAEFKKYESDINSWFELGRRISDTLAEAMEKIDWQSIYKKAEGFGKGLAEFLNGLITPRLFFDLAMTIANSLNTALHFLWSFGENFDWKNFGQSIAAGVNGFFKNFDFALLAETLNVWAQGIWTTLTEALGNIDWSLAIESIGNFLSNLDLKTVEIIIGLVMIKRIARWVIGGGALNALRGFLSPILAGQVAKIIGFDLPKDAGLFTAIKLAGKTLGQRLGSAIAASFSGVPLGKALSSVFGTVPTLIAGIGSLVGGAFLAVKSFFDMWENGWSLLKEILKDIGIAIGVVGSIILGAAAAPAAIVGAIIAAVSTVAIVIHDNWEAIKGVFAKAGEWFNQNVIEPIGGFFGALYGKISKVFTNAWEVVSNTWSSVAGWFSNNVITPITNFFGGLKTRVGQIFDGLWIIVRAIWSVVASWFYNTVVNPVITLFQSIYEKVSGFFKTLWDGIVSIWVTVSDWFNSRVVSPVVGFFFKLKTDIGNFFSQLWNGIKSVWETVSGWFENHVTEPVTSAFNTVCETVGGFFADLWNGIKSGAVGGLNAVIGAAESAVNYIIRGINSLFGKFNDFVQWGANILGESWSGVSLIPEVHFGRISFKNGGFPEDGLFFANHHELVGQFSNGKTAVANNSQIIEGIQGGVTRAIVQYLPEIIRDAVSAADTGGGDVYIGDEQIARAATRGQRKIDKRYNTAIQF